MFANGSHLPRLPMRQVTTYSFLCLTLLFNHDTFAAERYWVSIGSFSSLENANRLLNEVKQYSDDEARVQNLEQASKIALYRVVIGPYSTRSEANQRRVQLQIHYAKAWIWAENTPISAPSVTINRLGSVRETAPETENKILGVSADQQVEGELIEEAPPGYELHKLRRNQ